jgi:hypothetical protein
MLRKRSQKEQKLYILVDTILYNVWDALCVSISEASRDAYYCYLPHVYDLLIKTENGRDIDDYLVFIEESQMGAAKSDTIVRMRAEKTSRILLQYRKIIFKNKELDAP